MPGKKVLEHRSVLRPFEKELSERRPGASRGFIRPWSKTFTTPVQSFLNTSKESFVGSFIKKQKEGMFSWFSYPPGFCFTVVS